MRRRRGILEDLKIEVELEGYAPGTDAFDRTLRAKQVEKCKEMRGLFSCTACPYQDECVLLRAFMLDQKQKRPPGG